MAVALAENHDPAVPEGDFLADTTLTADPELPGRWYGAIPEAWKVVFAFGGMSMALAVRAIEQQLDRDDLELLSAHATFVAPVRCAPVEVDAVVLRDGRSAAQGTANLRNQGEDGTALHAVATFGRHLEHPIDFVESVYPRDAIPRALAPPPAPRPADSPFPTINFHEQTEWLPAYPPGFDFDDPDRPPRPARFGAWTRLVNEPRRADGSVDPLWLCVAGDSLGSAIGTKLGGRNHDDAGDFFTLTLEIGLQVFRPTTSAWVLQLTHAPAVMDGYGMSIVELWDEHEQLAGVATQRARLRPISRGDGFFENG